LRKTWNSANARAQNSNGKKNVIGWVRGPQDSAAATSDAKRVRSHALGELTVPLESHGSPKATPVCSTARLGGKT